MSWEFVVIRADDGIFVFTAAPPITWIMRRIYWCCERIGTENLLQHCVFVNSVANSPDFPHRSCLKRALVTICRIIINRELDVRLRNPPLIHKFKLTIRIKLTNIMIVLYLDWKTVQRGCKHILEESWHLFIFYWQQLKVAKKKLIQRRSEKYFLNHYVHVNSVMPSMFGIWSEKRERCVFQQFNLTFYQFVTGVADRMTWTGISVPTNQAATPSWCCREELMTDTHKGSDTWSRKKAGASPLEPVTSQSMLQEWLGLQPNVGRVGGSKTEGQRD